MASIDTADLTTILNNLNRLNRRNLRALLNRLNRLMDEHSVPRIEREESESPMEVVLRRVEMTTEEVYYTYLLPEAEEAEKKRLEREQKGGKKPTTRPNRPEEARQPRRGPTDEELKDVGWKEFNFLCTVLTPHFDDFARDYARAKLAPELARFDLTLPNGDTLAYSLFLLQRQLEEHGDWILYEKISRMIKEIFHMLDLTNQRAREERMTKLKEEQAAAEARLEREKKKAEEKAQEEAARKAQEEAARKAQEEAKKKAEEEAAAKKAQATKAEAEAAWKAAQATSTPAPPQAPQISVPPTESAPQPVVASPAPPVPFNGIPGLEALRGSLPVGPQPNDETPGTEGADPANHEGEVAPPAPPAPVVETQGAQPEPTIVEAPAFTEAEDLLFGAALDVVMESETASISSLARALEVTPQVAKSLLQRLEAGGIVSAADARGRRTYTGI